MRSFCAASLAPDALSTCQGELLEELLSRDAWASKPANTVRVRVSQHGRETVRGYEAALRYDHGELMLP